MYQNQRLFIQKTLYLWHQRSRQRITKVFRSLKKMLYSRFIEIYYRISENFDLLKALELIANSYFRRYEDFGSKLPLLVRLVKQLASSSDGNII